MEALMMGSIHAMEHASEHFLPGIPTGLHDLDQQLNGFQPSDLIILAARAGFGKTALVLQFAIAAAQHPPRHPVAVFSLEMSKPQLSMRMVCSEARLDAQRVRRAWLDAQERHRFYEHAGRLYELPILVDDTANTSVLEIRARCQRLQMERGLAMVVIDYLQLIAPSKRRDSRQQEVSDISRDLKILAKELNVPVIALSQLNRAIEQRGDKLPVLSDLRESGAIEQDADVVMFIYRGDLQQHNANAPTNTATQLIIAKQRNGPTGDIRLAFHKAYARFDPLAHGYEYAVPA
jgi:replicative DNA helicase